MLNVRLAVDRPDPENREFQRADPLAWTEANRGRILASVYTILLGNPRLRSETPSAAQTRFKAWWHLVGSAIEHTAKLKGQTVCFRELFVDGEADDEQSGSLACVLGVLREKWKEEFRSADVEKFARETTDDASAFLAALARASGKPNKGAISATEITWRLKALIDTRVQVCDGEVWWLNYVVDRKGGGRFSVMAKPVATVATGCNLLAIG